MHNRPTFKEYLAEEVYQSIAQRQRGKAIPFRPKPKRNEYRAREIEWKKQGYDSFFKKVLSQDNPYTPDTKAGRAWFQGWKNARNNDTDFKHRSPDSVSIRMSPERSAGHS